MPKIIFSFMKVQQERVIITILPKTVNFLTEILTHYMDCRNSTHTSFFRGVSFLMIIAILLFAKIKAKKSVPQHITTKIFYHMNHTNTIYPLFSPVCVRRVSYDQRLSMYVQGKTDQKRITHVNDFNRWKIMRTPSTS